MPFRALFQNASATLLGAGRMRGGIRCRRAAASQVTRLHLLSAHPGRTLATFDTAGFSFADLGSERFERVARDVHDLLFAPEARVHA